MDPLIIRSLLIALLEYAFALYVWRNGKLLRKSITFFLIFLASYQFGEFLFFITDQKFFVHIAAASATLLPPLGVYFLERISGRRYLSKIIAVTALFFVGGFLLVNNLFMEIDNLNCFVKLTNTNPDWQWFISGWSIWYSIALIIPVIGTLHNAVVTKDKVQRGLLIKLFFAYVSFFPTTFILLSLGMDVTVASSVMCSLAVVAAVITLNMSSVKFKLPKMS